MASIEQYMDLVKAKPTDHGQCHPGLMLCMTMMEALVANPWLQKEAEVQQEMKALADFVASIRTLPTVAVAEYLKY